MKFIPFPPALRQYAAAVVTASHAEHVQRRRASRKTLPEDHVTPEGAAYRLTDGTVRAAYDLYRPAYPAGAVPGMAELTHKVQWDAGGGHGYRTFCTKFEPASDLLANYGPWASAAAAYVREAGTSKGEGQLFVAPDEEALARMLEDAGVTSAAQIDRPEVELIGMDVEAAPTVIAYGGFRIGGHLTDGGCGSVYIGQRAQDLVVQLMPVTPNAMDDFEIAAHCTTEVRAQALLEAVCASIPARIEVGFMRADMTHVVIGTPDPDVEDLPQP